MSSTSVYFKKKNYICSVQIIILRHSRTVLRMHKELKKNRQKYFTNNNKTVKRSAFPEKLSHPRNDFSETPESALQPAGSFREQPKVPCKLQEVFGNTRKVFLSLRDFRIKVRTKTVSYGLS